MIHTKSWIDSDALSHLCTDGLCARIYFQADIDAKGPIGDVLCWGEQIGKCSWACLPKEDMAKISEWCIQYYKDACIESGALAAWEYIL